MHLLSVLALSSRFDGAWQDSEQQGNLLLSVLALSSRFDGLPVMIHPGQQQRFQYSLCRVVLMVSRYRLSSMALAAFQYSLCRVVLMVTVRCWQGSVSVGSFSTRSVESF